MLSTRISIKEFIRTNRILCFALIAGQLMFAVISIFLVKVNGMSFGKTDLYNVFLYLVPLLSLSCIIGGFAYFKSKIKLIKERSELYEKFAEYRSAQIIRWSLLEGPSFFSIMAFIITSSYLFLAIAAIMISIFFITIPTNEKLEKDLELSWEEKNQFCD